MCCSVVLYGVLWCGVVCRVDLCRVFGVCVRVVACHVALRVVVVFCLVLSCLVLACLVFSWLVVACLVFFVGVL